MQMTGPFLGAYDGNFSSQQGLPEGSRLPILAPRPTDFSVAEQSTFSTTSDPSPHQETQIANTAPFYYPPTRMHAPLPLASEAAVRTDQEALSPQLAHDHPELTMTSDGGDLRSSGAPLSSPSQSYNLPTDQNTSWVLPQVQAVTSQDTAHHASQASAPQRPDMPATSEV